MRGVFKLNAAWVGMPTAFPPVIPDINGNRVIDDDDFAVLDDVFLVVLVDHAGPQGILDEVWPLHIGADIEAADPGNFLSLANAVVSHVDGLLVQLHLVMLNFVRQIVFGLGEFPRKPL